MRRAEKNRKDGLKVLLMSISGGSSPFMNFSYNNFM
jgi:hypothetical protein